MKLYMFVGVYGGVVNEVKVFTDRLSAIEYWEKYTSCTYNVNEEVQDEMIDGTHIWDEEVPVFQHSENLDKNKVVLTVFNDSKKPLRVRRANINLKDFTVEPHKMSYMTVYSNNIFVKSWGNNVILIAENINYLL